MSKRGYIGMLVAGLLLAVLVAGIASEPWEPELDQPHELPTFTTGGADSIYDEDGNLKENSLAYAVFEKYGFVLIPLALLMFGAMVGGVVISREEVEE